MIYSTISSLSFEKGRVLLMCCRFNASFTGNFTLDQEFTRRCLEWVSSKGETELVNVYVVVMNNVDGSPPIIDSSDYVNVKRISVEDLSEYDLIKDASCVVIFGVDNNVSPVVRSNIVDYVKNGGGLVLSDVNVNNDYISILDDFSPVYCTNSGIIDGSIKSYWTFDGGNSFLYGSGKFENVSIPPINTIYDTGFSSPWEILQSHNTDIPDPGPVAPPEIDGPVFSSDDYDVPGCYFMGYFSSCYKNGVFNINKRRDF